MRTSSLVIRSSIIAALGGLLFGFDTAVISGTTEALTDKFQLSQWWLGFTVAIALFGTIFGAALVKFPTDSLGRKPTLIWIAALYFISAIGTALPWDWYSFLFFRFLGGLAIGASSVVSPLYTTEIAPAKSRGILVAITQFNIVFGILLAFFSNYIIAGLDIPGLLLTPEYAWRWMFGVAAVPSAAFFLLLFLNPESPRWLMTKGSEELARSILSRLGNDTGSVDEELKIIRDSIQQEVQGGRETMLTMLWRFRFPLGLAVVMAFFNQLSGINAVLYYAPKVFKLAGASEGTAMFFPVIIGFINIFVTMAAMAAIDRFGRRKLMIVGSLGYITSLAVVAAAFTIYGPEFNLSIKAIAVNDTMNALKKAEENIAKAQEEEKAFWQKKFNDIDESLQKAKTEKSESISRYKEKYGKELGDDGNFVPKAGLLIVLVGLICFVASHAFGQGACIWVFISEIFPNKVRALGQGLASLTLWVFCALVSQLFPPMLEMFGPANVFFFFSGMMVLQLIWVLALMPETKQVSLEEMQKLFGIKD
ncbi:MAG: sugar porter family MFS transporter [Planctomycetaceae bacterium]|nr:sugar porter family MFS transporter [Planctomycetaceae bacterium]